MVSKHKEDKIPEPVDMKTGIDLLQKQIEAAKQLMNNRPLKQEDHASWNNQTHDCLVRIYGEGSPNIDTITHSSGAAPAWLFMPDDTAERYAAASLENKLQLLKGCVTALRRKAKQAS